MQAKPSTELELKWLVQRQLRLKGITSISSQRRTKPGYGQWRRKLVALTSIRKNELCSSWQ